MATYILAIFLHSKQQKWDQGTMGKQRSTRIGSRTRLGPSLHYIFYIKDISFKNFKLIFEDFAWLSVTEFLDIILPSFIYNSEIIKVLYLCFIKLEI